MMSDQDPSEPNEASASTEPSRSRFLESMGLGAPSESDDTPGTSSPSEESENSNDLSTDDGVVLSAEDEPWNSSETKPTAPARNLDISVSVAPRNQSAAMGEEAEEIEVENELSLQIGAPDGGEALASETPAADQSDVGGEVLNLECPACDGALALRNEHLGIEGQCVWCDMPIIAARSGMDGEIRVFPLGEKPDAREVAVETSPTSAGAKAPEAKGPPEEAAPVAEEKEEATASFDFTPPASEAPAAEEKEEATASFDFTPPVSEAPAAEEKEEATASFDFTPPVSEAPAAEEKEEAIASFDFTPPVSEAPAAEKKEEVAASSDFTPPASEAPAAEEKEEATASFDFAPPISEAPAAGEKEEVAGSSDFSSPESNDSPPLAAAQSTEEGAAKASIEADSFGSMDLAQMGADLRESAENAEEEKDPGFSSGWGAAPAGEESPADTNAPEETPPDLQAKPKKEADKSDADSDGEDVSGFGNFLSSSKQDEPAGNGGFASPEPWGPPAAEKEENPAKTSPTSESPEAEDAPPASMDFGFSNPVAAPAAEPAADEKPAVEDGDDSLAAMGWGKAGADPSKAAPDQIVSAPPTFAPDSFVAPDIEAKSEPNDTGNAAPAPWGPPVETPAAGDSSSVEDEAPSSKTGHTDDDQNESSDFGFAIPESGQSDGEGFEDASPFSGFSATPATEKTTEPMPEEKPAESPFSAAPAEMSPQSTGESLFGGTSSVSSDLFGSAPATSEPPAKTPPALPEEEKAVDASPVALGEDAKTGFGLGGDSDESVSYETTKPPLDTAEPAASPSSAAPAPPKVVTAPIGGKKKKSKVGFTILMVVILGLVCGAALASFVLPVDEYVEMGKALIEAKISGSAATTNPSGI